MTSEQKQFYERQLENIRNGGNAFHQAWVQDRIWGLGEANLGPVDPPVVGFAQDGDPFYAQYFQNWDEVNEMINHLRKECEEAWGKEK